MHAISKVTALSVLALSGIATANASIVTPNSSGGSEAILSIVNNATSDSISIDLGTQVSGLTLGSTFNLDAGVLAGQMGQVAMVIEAESTTQGTVKEALRRLDHCPHISLICNKARSFAGGDYYGYYD